MTESDLWAKIRESHDDVFWQRIETSTAVGVPDTYFAYDGFVAWCELKWLDKPPKKDIIIKIHHYTLAQRTWLYDNMKNGGHSLLCLGFKDHIRWFYGVDALVVGTLKEKELLERSYDNLYTLIKEKR